MKAVLIVVVLLGSAVSAAAAPFKVNDRVVTTRSTMLTTPAIPGRTNAVRYAQLAPGSVLVVQKVSGDMLGVDDVQPGWVRRSDVVTLEEGQVIFSDRIAKDRFRGDWYLCRGNVLLALEEYDSAQRDFAEAILREARSQSDALVGRAAAVRRSPAATLAVLNVLRGNSSGAIPPPPKQDLTSAVARDRKNPKVLLARAQIESGANKLPYLNEAIRHNPLSAQAYAARAEYYKGAKNDNKAAEDTKIVKLLQSVWASPPENVVAAIMYR